MRGGSVWPCRQLVLPFPRDGEGLGDPPKDVVPVGQLSAITLNDTVERRYLSQLLP